MKGETPQKQATEKKETVQAHDIRENLLQWDAMDAVARKQKQDITKQAKEHLENLQLQISLGLKTNPLIRADDDYNQLLLMISDLLGDIEAKRSLDIDSSLEEIQSRIETRLQERGIQRTTPDTLKEGSLKTLTKRLQSLGITPEYVLQTDQNNAQTIILVAQRHYRPGMTAEQMKDLGVLESQTTIRDQILTLHRENIIGGVLGEMIHFGETLQQEQADQFQTVDGICNAALTLSGKLPVHGFNSEGSMQKIMIEYASGKSSEEVERNRGVYDNIFLADNIAQTMFQNDYDVAYAAIGYNHEIELSESPGSHPFPISSVLAYEGLNVIVVDESSISVEDRPEK